MAKSSAFFCEIQRYEELCDMFDGKIVDFALVRPGQKIGPLERGYLRIAEDHSEETQKDGVWVTVEIHPGEDAASTDISIEKVTLSEDELRMIVRAPDDSEADWILGGNEPAGVSEADV